MLTAALPLLLGRWFGVDPLDERVAVAIAVLFGASAVALPWLAGRRPAEPLPPHGATAQNM